MSFRTLLVILWFPVAGLVNAEPEGESANIFDSLKACFYHKTQVCPKGEEGVRFVGKEEEKIDGLIEQDPDNPRNYVLKGMASLAYRFVQPGLYSGDDAGWEKYNKEAKGYYTRAMLLDLKAKDADKLETEMLNAVRRFGDSENIVKASRRLIKRDKVISESPRRLIEVKAHMANNLAKLGRYGEARQVMDDLKEQYPKYAHNIQIKEKQIEDRIAETREKRKKEKVSVQEESENTKIQSPSDHDSRDQRESPDGSRAGKSEPTGNTNFEGGILTRVPTIVVYIALLLVILGGVAFWLYRRRKR